MSVPTIRALEEASLNAWPARQQLVDDGWLVRFNDGYTRRANSVNPLYAPEEGGSDAQLERRLAKWEHFYRRKGRPTVFKITPLVQPSHLDACLAGRGYRRQAPTGVRVRPLSGLRSSFEPLPGAGVAIESVLSDAWLDRFAAFSAAALETLPAMRAILENIAPVCCFVTQWVEGTPVACGLGVLDGSLFGLYDIVTRPGQRGKGYGAYLLHALLTWARDAGASHAYLAVMDDNAPARRLYDKWGFVEMYPYWYRVKDSEQ